MKLFLFVLAIVFGLAATLAATPSWAGASAGAGHMGQMSPSGDHDCPMDDCDTDGHHVYRCLMANGHCEVPQIETEPVSMGMPAKATDSTYEFTARIADLSNATIDPPPPRS